MRRTFHRSWPRHRAPRRSSVTDQTNEPRTERDFVRRFAEFLRALEIKEREPPHEKSRKRAILARLRRGLGKAPGEVVETAQYIDPRLPPDARYGEEEFARRIE